MLHLTQTNMVVFFFFFFLSLLLRVNLGATVRFFCWNLEVIYSSVKQPLPLLSKVMYVYLPRTYNDIFMQLVASFFCKNKKIYFLNFIFDTKTIHVATMMGKAQGSRVGTIVRILIFHKYLLHNMKEEIVL